MPSLMPTTRPYRPAVAPRTSAFQAILLVQGGYYLLTALWGLVDLDSFQAVTGPKTDLWLVRTVSVLLVAVAGCLLLAARKPEPSAEVVLLAASSALGLTGIDVFYVAGCVIAPVYLLDAAAEVALLAWWAWLGLTHEPSPPRHDHE